MARRRVNKKFLLPAILVSVVLGSGLALAAMWKLYWGKDPIPHVMEGDRKYTAGDYAGAITAYAKAIQLKDTDPMVWVKLGDAHSAIAAEDPENLRKAVSVWQNVTQQDPRLVEAHRRLLDYFTQFADLPGVGGATQAEYRDQAITHARAILLVKPDDRQARFIVARNVIDSWLEGTPTDPQKIEESITQLRELQTEDPSDAEVVYVIASAKAMQGYEEIKRNNRENGFALYDEAIKVIEDAIAANPQNGLMLIYKAQLLGRVGIRGSERDDPNNLEMVRELTKTLAELSDAGRKLMKPDDKFYVRAQLFAAMALQRAERPEEAEKLLRDLAQERPDDLYPKIQLAELLRRSRDKYDEALNLIETAIKDVKPKPGIEGFITPFAVRNAKLIVCDIRLAQYAYANEKGDRAKADAIMKQIEEDFAFATSKGAENPRALRIRGKIELYKGDVVAATQTFRLALTMATDPSDTTRSEIMLELARTLQFASQTGEAEKLFREITDRLDFPPARIELARLLLGKRAVEEAKGHIAILKQQQPKNPEVVQLELAVADMENRSDPAEAQKRFNDLPEDNDDQKLRKARLALMAKLPDEAIRIMQPLYDANRDNVRFMLPIAGAYEQKGQQDRVLELLNEYQGRHPDNMLVRDYKDRLSGATPEQRTENLKVAIERQYGNDPVQLAMALFEMYRRSGEPEKAEQTIVEAAKTLGENPRIKDAQFQIAYSKGDYDTCDRMMDELAKANSDNANGRIYRTRVLLARAQMEPDATKRSGYYERATEEVIKLTDERTDFTSAWLLRGQVMHAQRRFEEAITAYSTAKERQAQNLEAYEGLIRCYYALKRTDDAKRVIDAAGEMFPQNEMFKEFALAWQAQHGDPNLVIPARKAQLEKNPEVANNWGNLAAAYAAAAQKLEGDEQTKMLELSRKTFADGIAKFPNEIPLISTHGDISLILGRYEEGLKPWLALANNEQFRDSPVVAVRVAEYYRRAGKNDEGIAFLHAFLARKDDPTVRILLADFHNDAKNLDEALKQLAAAGNGPRAIKRRTELLITNKRQQEAEQIINDALARDPSNTDFINRLAFVYMTTNRFDEARQLLAKVLGMKPNDPEALFYSAVMETTLPNGNIDKAIEYLVAVCTAVPDNVDARKLLVDVYFRRNRIDPALAEMETILRLDSADKFTRIKLIETFLGSQPPRVVDAERLCKEAQNIPELVKDADMMHAYARTLLIKGDIQAAVDWINKARTADPENLPLMDTFFRVMMGAKQYQAIVTEASKLIEKHPKFSWLWSTRATAYARLKQVEKAMGDFEKGYEAAQEANDEFGGTNIIRAMMQEVGIETAIKFLQPRVKDNPSRTFILAQAYQAAGRFDDALKTGRAVIEMPELKPAMRVGVLNFLGTLYLTQNPPDFRTARQTYEEVLKLIPDDFRALNNMAYVLQQPESGAKPGEARGYAERAFKEMERQNNMIPEILDTYGWILVSDGLVEQGIAILRDAVTRKPTLVEGWFHLAAGYMKAENKDEADAALKKAEELMEGQRRRGQPVDPTMEREVQALRLEISK